MPESIGERLKREREARRLTLEKAAEATRVRVHYLQALENDDYSAMSSAAQGRGFLRLYADFLNVDLDAAMDEMRHAEKPPADSPASTPEPASSSDGSTALITGLEPARGGFWARLLRRPASESPAKAEEPKPAEAEIAPDTIPQSADLAESRPAPQSKLAEYHSAPRAKATRSTRAKPASKKGQKKTAKPARARTIGKPKSKPKARSAGKKKQTLTPKSKR